MRMNLADPWRGLGPRECPVDMFVAKRAESPLRSSTAILLSLFSASVGLGHLGSLAPAEGEERDHWAEKVINRVTSSEELQTCALPLAQCLRRKGFTWLLGDLGPTLLLLLACYVTVDRTLNPQCPP